MSSAPLFHFDGEKLSQQARALAAQFREAQPFAHVTLDDFLPVEVAHSLAREFPPVAHPGWQVWGPGPVRQERNPHRDKLGMSDESFFPSGIRAFMLQLCSATFIRFVEELSGIARLIADPSFSGCGLHSTGRDGRLMVHADASRHPHGKAFHQALNAILYLNEDWSEEWGGHLELWSRDARRCVERIAPVFNRIVIFETHSFSYHGHPHPLACPADRRRNSLASYYYVLDREASPDYLGYQARPQWVRAHRE